MVEETKCSWTLSPRLLGKILKKKNFHKEHIDVGFFLLEIRSYSHISIYDKNLKFENLGGLAPIWKLDVWVIFLMKWNF